MNKRKVELEKALFAIKKFYRVSKSAYEKRQEIGNGEVIVGELPNGIDITGFSITYKEIDYSVTIKSYPDCIVNEKTAPLRSKKLKSFINKLKSTMVGFDGVELILTKLPQIEELKLSEEEELEELEDRLIRIEKEEESKRAQLVKKSPASVFTIISNSPRPMRFSFVPDGIFILMCENHLHSTYAKLFKDFHIYNSDEVTVECPKGKIQYYKDPKMNECLMYLVNKLCNKKYYVDAFQLPEVLKKLMEFGTPKIEESEEELDDLLDEENEVDSIFDNELHKKFHQTNLMNVDVREFTIYMINHLTDICLYNPSETPSIDNVQYDKNNLFIKDIISDYCRLKEIATYHLFVDNHEKNDKRSIEDDNSHHDILVSYYQIIYSNYYSIYHEDSIADDLFTKKKTETKGDDDTKNKMK